jgi:transcriptional regulator NrdR family protein
MKCPACKSPDSRVVRSEQTPSGTERVRIHRCCRCGHVFVTRETYQAE